MAKSRRHKMDSSERRNKRDRQDFISRADKRERREADADVVAYLCNRQVNQEAMVKAEAEHNHN